MIHYTLVYLNNYCCSINIDFIAVTAAGVRHLNSYNGCFYSHQEMQIFYKNLGILFLLFIKVYFWYGKHFQKQDYYD
jgi:hypothetical protein